MQRKIVLCRCSTSTPVFVALTIARIYCQAAVRFEVAAQAQPQVTSIGGWIFAEWRFYVCAPVVTIKTPGYILAAGHLSWLQRQA
jgi:hypothetical protein